jgi:hypothetical protein
VWLDEKGWPVRLTFTGRQSRKRFKLGDELKVIVCRIDVHKWQIDFVPVVETPRRPARRH